MNMRNKIKKRDKTNSKPCVMHFRSHCLYHAAFVVLTAALLVAGCASTPPPRAIDLPSGVQTFAARNLEDPALQAFLADHRPPAHWPLQSWTADDLAFAALYFHADYRVAEAEQQAAERLRERDLQRPNPQLGVKAERSNDPAIRSPWTVALELSFTLPSASRRSARETLADLRVQQAALKKSDTAWRLRAQVRDGVRELEYARDQLALHEREAALADQQLQMLDKRMALGAASRAELGARASRAARSAQAIAEVKAQVTAATANLAAATGVPSESIAGLRLSGGSENERADFEFADYQRNALQRRHDIRRALLDYGEAEANIVLAATRDRDITLAPGIKWDQGANVWGLAAAFVLPLLHDNRASVAAAVAQRETAARRVDAAQQLALADIHAAWTAWQSERAVVVVARTTRVAELRNVELAQKNFARGMTDRFELAEAESVFASAELRLKRAENMLARAAGRLEDAGQYALFDSSGAVNGGPLAGSTGGRP